jgi:fluoroacetyl-CoA thioesterase
MTPADLKPGLRHSQSLVVDESLTVPSVNKAFASFADMPPVLATAFMVACAEWACLELLRPYLGADQRTVGTHVDLSHCAATPVGMRVTADVELIAVEGRKLRFKVVCRDDAEIIGEGFHDRAIVDMARFLDRVTKKRAA